MPPPEEMRVTSPLRPSQPDHLAWPSAWWKPDPGMGYEPEDPGRRPGQAARRWLIPALLLLTTLLTTLLAGAFQRGFFPTAILAHPLLIFQGLPFAGTLLLILGAHECGHYLAGRRWGVDVSPPYFIPAPTLFGTFGAVIRIRGKILNRNALLDVAAAGPLAGMAVALPAVLIGLSLSRVVTGGEGEAAQGLGLGTPWLFDFAARAILGPLEPRDDVVLHPVAFAGWCGFLVTALNLIPAGQLDGGHVVYTLFGRWHRAITLAVGVLLLGMAFWWEGWLLWGAIVLVLSRSHPPLLDEWTPLSAGRKWLGFACLALLALTFIWVPIHLP